MKIAFVEPHGVPRRCWGEYGTKVRGLAGLLAVLLGGLTLGAGGASAQTAFYSATGADLTHYADGGLIRSEPMDGAPDGAAAYRVLYRSKGLHDEPIAVSGVVIVPAGPPPPGGRLIVAWAHPTTGIVSKCAPSLAHVLFSSIQG